MPPVRGRGTAPPARGDMPRRGGCGGCSAVGRAAGMSPDTWAPRTDANRSVRQVRDGRLKEAGGEADRSRDAYEAAAGMAVVRMRRHPGGIRWFRESPVKGVTKEAPR
ncbi:hypothetical protein Stube_23800 [Streptomyces tubercidicus]|uniref:Uncharacterized protein n=1 Tax=Streptomyces tubercidicus TaxID=47759 RepID=A0A640UPN0_9ACTN|nr:hypothetical protein Stube_23800 [Streptomyces tubercidicus]